jgi:hypothetical protein
MATTQTIQWLALPNGLTGAGETQKVRLSVFVSPRLRGDDQQATLQAFPDFLNWAARTQPDGLHFDLEIDNGVRLAAQTVSAPPDPRLWEALFAADTPVERHRFDDLADRPLITFSVKGVLAYLQQCYSQVADAALDDLPAIMPSPDVEGSTGLTTLFEDLVNLHQSGFLEGVQDADDLSRRLADRLNAARNQARLRRADPNRGVDTPIQPYAGGDNPRDHFTQLLFFHRRPQAEPVALPDDGEVAAYYRNRVDFHQMLAALGDYPTLLRRLGLVFDLEVAAADLPETPDEFAMRKVRVLPVERAGEYSPWTAYWHSTLAGQRFFTAVPRQDHNLGIWTLREEDFLLTQLDLDGAALKALHMASTLYQQQGQADRPIDAPDKAGTPALRTSGISLVRQGHAEKLHNDFHTSLRNNRQIEGDQPVTLNAEDLCQGYRLDVWDDQTGEWRSLHQRIGTYNPLTYADGPFAVTDEGFFQLSVGGAAEDKATPPDPDGELYVHEALVTWDGWSLSAPRPGRSINRNPRAPTPDDPDTQPVRVPNQALTAMQLTVTAAAQPGTLPRLRFDRAYRFRVRTVDLAGNGPTVDEATALAASFGAELGAQFPAQQGFRYGRFEPVNAPVLLPRRRYSEGESLERLVIRSNVDQASGDYAATHPQYLAVNERHVAAPKTSQHMVEAHGLLDAAFDTHRQGVPAEQATAVINEMYEIARREKGSLNDTTLDPAIEFIRTNSDPAGTEGYTIHPQAQLELPYLPDPLATGVVLRGVPGTPVGEAVTLTYPNEPWYNARPFRLQLAEGDGAPQWDETERVLTISLPPATIATIRLNSSLPEGAFTTMGLWRWFEEQPLAHIDELKQAVAENRHWLFTPWREITLVHAVQQPLAAPQVELALEDGAFARGWAETRAMFRGEFFLHSPSTAQVDLLAQWREPQDDPAAGPPLWGEAMRSHSATVFSFAIPQPGDPLPAVEPQLLHFDGDPLERVGFDMALYQHEWRTVLQQQLAAATAPEQRRLQRLIDQLEQLKPHEFNDTHYREVTYHLTATTRFREYFDQAAITDGRLTITQQGNQTVVKMLSSAPPAAPKVRYVIPTWQWVAETNDTTISRRRVGGSVRVYLDRPWFSAGEGELLGVVLGGEFVGANPSTPRSADYPYISHFGRDPLRQSAGLASPGVASFTNVVQSDRRLRLAELGGNELVAVAGFAVDFDAERDLWYGDIAIDTAQAYYPFVRLALVRYQPNAIAGAHLSPVVLADLVQTVPDRTCRVTPSADQPGQYTVTVSGPVYRTVRTPAGAEVVESSDVELCLHRRVPAIADEVLGWEETPASRQPLPITLTADGASATWSGTVTVPATLAGERLRLTVEEYEPFWADGAQPGAPVERVRRLVYVDHVELP